MSLVLLDVDAATGIARLTFNRPEVLNAIDVPLARALNSQVTRIAEDPRIRCIVMSGAGRAFIAGGDLGRFAQDFDGAAAVVDELLDALHPAILALRDMDAPVVAGVHGAVAGAGLSLMSACDLVIAAEGTRFMMAYDRVGATPDCGGTHDLPRILGTRRAAQFYLLSETINAQEALDIGLVNRVVAPADLDEAVAQWAKKIASGPTRAYGHYKRLVSQTYMTPLSSQLEAERATFKASTQTEDFRRGVLAFTARQACDFTGR